MKPSQVLITGGAGFIGSHLADELLKAGYGVRILDNLSPQVHGSEPRRPDYLADEVDLMVGDVRDHDTVRRALRGIDAVYHFAAAVGVGQSMYEVAHYTSVNNLGTAVLLEALVERPVERLIVASSMSLYGEAHIFALTVAPGFRGRGHGNNFDAANGRYSMLREKCLPRCRHMRPNARMPGASTHLVNTIRNECA